MKDGYSVYYEAKKNREANIDRLFNEVVRRAEESIGESVVMGKYSATVEMPGCPGWLKEDLTKRIRQFFEDWGYKIEWTAPSTFVLRYERKGE